ncbi:acyl-CoA N-acyltransferase [Metschnikowia bicuspidata var. bicuspidata NRRL YB-4993]|uniref:Acyl-CoA N-acyltransferase n=1 Tax=Metschnikowia bicuspidata var. bicuspidata NRRL YB-4993 TaxID=869754 RepID=A0A1A0HJU3_9ASCO|nr:acyl-CoA N-acyltransferase [Metschnikowia bicuspidata var. bicuspidata NRRL YB-4993]OBA24444.1 acyl-CoA N-acyltransferase [Metschnikowia bicuspidata var. bicuspidata NRRL YB-4993]
MGRSVITLDDLTPNNLGTFKKINEVSLPTSYPESWYKESLDSAQIVKLAFYNELPVGAIKGKLFHTSHKLPNFELSTKSNMNTKIVMNALYLESLAVLKAYRNQGVASELLQWIISEAKSRFVHEIFLHVHVENDEAIQWYKKKGFVQKDEVVKDYYKEQGLPQPDAAILSISF